MPLSNPLAAQAGQLELNVMMPLISWNLTFSLELLKNCVQKFTESCIKGITANEERCRRYLEDSLGLVTVLAPWSYMASVMYHDSFWYPMNADRTMKDVLGSEWGRLFQNWDQLALPPSVTSTAPAPAATPAASPPGVAAPAPAAAGALL